MLFFTRMVPRMKYEAIRTRHAVCPSKVLDSIGIYLHAATKLEPQFQGYRFYPLSVTARKGIINSRLAKEQEIGINLTRSVESSPPTADRHLTNPNPLESVPTSRNAAQILHAPHPSLESMVVKGIAWDSLKGLSRLRVRPSRSALKKVIEASNETQESEIQIWITSGVSPDQLISTFQAVSAISVHFDFGVKFGESYVSPSSPLRNYTLTVAEF